VYGTHGSSKQGKAEVSRQPPIEPQALVRVLVSELIKRVPPESRAGFVQVSSQGLLAVSSRFVAFSHQFSTSTSMLLGFGCRVATSVIARVLLEVSQSRVRKGLEFGPQTEERGLWMRG
jgi:hypothetical protein